MTVRAFVGLGSNLGDRLGNCRVAVGMLASLPETRLLDLSPLYESDPAEGAQGGPFLNAVAGVETLLPADVLFGHLRGIEVALGRPPHHGPGQARPVDLDLLLYGEERIDAPGLQVPHPRLAARRFVLEPLCRIAPDALHPGLGATAADLLARLPAGEDLRLVGWPVGPPHGWDGP